ncbi:M24 family metallopeptidase [Marinicrinis lubricantis]
MEKLRQRMEHLGYEAYFTSHSYNRRYISGFTGSSGYVLVTKHKAILFTDFRYMTQAPMQAKAFEVIEHGPNVMEHVLKSLQEQGIRQLAFEKEHVSYAEYEQFQSSLSGIELIPADSLIEQLRMYKDAEEIQIMQEAADLADRTFEHLLHLIRPGMKELDVALEIEMFMRKNGAASTSFDTIAASGERSAMPHGTASDRVLGKNEFLTLDYGAYYKGYCSDITRTIVIGKPSEKHREIYNIVLEAQLACLEGLKPGLTGREGDALARDIIAKYGYGDHFGHGTGHGLGLEVHEAPRLSKTCDTVLESGMAVTVEPGIYLPGFGGVRIEDDVILTDSGIRVLTKAPKDLITID